MPNIDIIFAIFVLLSKSVNNTCICSYLHVIMHIFDKVQTNKEVMSFNLRYILHTAHTNLKLTHLYLISFFLIITAHTLNNSM